MNNIRRLRRGMPGIRLTIAVLAMIGAIGTAWCQNQYPSRVVKIVVPYPPGGNTDVLTRLYASSLSEMLGQTFLIDNRPGAGTNVGAEYVARSAPDGYALFVVQLASHGINPSLFSKLPFDPIKDFSSVGFMARSPMFLFVNSALPVVSVRDLVRYARTHPGTVSFASAGNGSPQHLAGVLFTERTGIDALHVPYKGAAQALLDLMSGRVQFMFDSSAMTYVKQGKLKVLAVANATRWATEPGVPTTAESGVSGVEVPGYFGLSAPAGTPDAVLQKLNDAMNDIARREETTKRLAQMGLVPMTGSRAEMTRFIAEQIAKWRPIVKASGAKVD